MGNRRDGADFIRFLVHNIGVLIGIIYRIGEVHQLVIIKPGPLIDIAGFDKEQLNSAPIIDITRLDIIKVTSHVTVLPNSTTKSNLMKGVLGNRRFPLCATKKII